MPAMVIPAPTPTAAELNAQPTSSTITTVAWVPEEGLDHEEWRRTGRRLGMMNRCSPWWLGDWINYGSTKFGEKYTQAAEITGYDTQTLMNMVYVASKFEISRRREMLSWSHHESVAALTKSEQDHWLGRAIDQKLSVAKLRQELRSRHVDSEDAATGAQAEIGVPHHASITCPQCGHSITPAEIAGQLDGRPSEHDAGATSRLHSALSRQSI